jgi:hypothetical protein
VHLELISDDFKEHKTIVFMDVTRCLVTNHGMENIVYSLDILADSDSPKFMAARQFLDRSTPFDRGLPPKKIAMLSASFGGEAWIECSQYRVLSKNPDCAVWLIDCSDRERPRFLRAGSPSTSCETRQIVQPPHTAIHKYLMTR